MALPMSNENEHVLARIDAVALDRPCCDRGRAEAAIARHLERIELDARPTRWIVDVGAGRARCTHKRDARAWWRARASARTAAKRAAIAAGWRPSRPDLPVADVWAAVEEATRSDEPPRAWETLPSGSEPIPPNAVAPWLVDAVRWSSVPPEARSAAPVSRWIDACLAFLDAYEAGLGFFWILDDEVVAVPRPAIRVERGVLHDAAGPAVAWPGGAKYWFWRGIRVPRQAVEEPDALTVADIHSERNLEVRRVLLERMGYERYVREARGKVRNEDAFGRLWECRSLPGEREPLILVEVLNATDDSDGGRRRFFLRVPPTTRTAREAVAWSFGFERPGDYGPIVET